MKSKLLFAALAAAAATLSLAQAQNEQVPREHRMGRAVPAAALMNRDVVTQSGKSVGQIEEVIFDMESGRILYVGLNLKGAGKGDMVGIPPTLFALPRAQQQAARNDDGGLRAQPKARALVIRANEQALQGAPKFAKDAEEMAQGAYVDKVYAHFNQPRWWEGASGDSKAGKFNHVRRASQVKNFAVQNSSNEKLGQVETVLFDLPAGRVSYVLLDPVGNIVNKQVLIPVPPMAFTRGQEARTLILDADKEKLNNAPSINRDDLKAEDIQRLSNPQFAAKVYNYYGKQPWFQSENIPTPTGPDREQNQQNNNN
jgi:sporulation protein YlmC with PRC-barrel domain